MRLLGARNLKEIVPEMVDTSSLRSHSGSVPDDRLYNVNCKSISLAIDTFYRIDGTFNRSIAEACLLEEHSGGRGSEVEVVDVDGSIEADCADISRFGHAHVHTLFR